MAASGDGAAFPFLTSLFGRFGRVLRLVLNTQLQLARAEQEKEVERAGRVAMLAAVGGGLLAFSLVTGHLLAIVLLMEYAGLEPAIALGVVFAADVVLGAGLLMRAKSIASEREWMIDTRTRAAETLEILRG